MKNTTNYMREYRKTHREKIRESANKYARKDRLANPEKYRIFTRSEKNKEIQARYRAKHKVEISERNIRYAKNKKKICPEFKIRQLLRNRILSALKKDCNRKAYKSMELLGCSIKEYKEHLEKQFKDGMTWKNHGILWEIDHIIPVATFNLLLPEEQKKAFHFSNTQPLDLKLNRKKQPKRLTR
jgi:hypothetical protein